MWRTTWTDERLDVFSRDVDHRLDELDRRFDRIDAGLRRLSTLVQVWGLAVMVLVGILLGTSVVEGS
jgi:hypothetical protein